MKYRAECEAVIVDRGTKDYLTEPEQFAFEQVCVHEPMNYADFVDTAAFHYGAKLLRDAMRVPELKLIIKENFYAVEILTLVIYEIGETQ